MLILVESITGEAGIEPAGNPDSKSGGFANVAYSPINSGAHIHNLTVQRCCALYYSATGQQSPPRSVSNRRHSVLQTDALPTELPGDKGGEMAIRFG
jgi:hypothetical protein